jgi:pilus assembly protein CpaF
MEGPAVTTQDLFVFERHGFDEKHRVKGNFKPTGILPKFTERLLGAGVRLTPDAFSAVESYERKKGTGPDRRGGGSR